MSKKLYKVTCKGMQSSTSGIAHGVAYVVCGHPTEAYQILRDALEKDDIGFYGDRELHSIELIAEEGKYPSSGYALYLSQGGETMPSKELIVLLRQQAADISNRRINGWGNTMLEAVRKIEELEGRLKYNAKENERHGNTNK